MKKLKRRELATPSVKQNPSLEDEEQFWTTGQLGMHTAQANGQRKGSYYAFFVIVTSLLTLENSDPIYMYMY